MRRSTVAPLLSCLVALFLAAHHGEANQRPKEVFNVIFNEEEWWELAIAHLNVLRQHLANLPPLVYDSAMARRQGWSNMMSNKKFFKEPVLIENDSISDFGALTALEGLKMTWNKEFLEQWVICNDEGECFSKCCPCFAHKDSTKIWLIGRFLRPKKHRNAISAEIYCSNSNNNGMVNFQRFVDNVTGQRKFPTMFHCRDIVYDEVRQAMCPGYVRAQGKYVEVGVRTQLMLDSPLGKIMTETLKESLERLRTIHEPWMHHRVRSEAHGYSTGCPCSLNVPTIRYQVPKSGKASTISSASIGYKPARVDPYKPKGLRPGCTYADIAANRPCGNQQQQSTSGGGSSQHQSFTSSYSYSVKQTFTSSYSSSSSFSGSNNNNNNNNNQQPQQSSFDEEPMPDPDTSKFDNSMALVRATPKRAPNVAETERSLVKFGIQASPTRFYDEMIFATDQAYLFTQFFLIQGNKVSIRGSLDGFSGERIRQMLSMSPNSDQAPAKVVEKFIATHIEKITLLMEKTVDQLAMVPKMSDEDMLRTTEKHSTLKTRQNLERAINRMRDKLGDDKAKLEKIGGALKELMSRGEEGESNRLIEAPPPVKQIEWHAADEGKSDDSAKEPENPVLAEERRLTGDGGSARLALDMQESMQDAGIEVSSQLKSNQEGLVKSDCTCEAFRAIISLLENMKTVTIDSSPKGQKNKKKWHQKLLGKFKMGKMGKRVKKFFGKIFRFIFRRKPKPKAKPAAAKSESP